MTMKTKRVGLFIMTGDDASIPLNSKGEPYVLIGEVGSTYSGYVKFAESEIEYSMPPRSTVAEAMLSKLLADKATLTEETAVRAAALETLIQRLQKGDSA